MTTSIMETAGLLRFVATARHGVLAELVTALRQASAFVALTGSAGVGKTTLARAARDQLREHGIEAVWISRGDGETIDLRSIAAQLLDKPEATINGDDVGPLFDVMTAATPERRLVIVVDDAEALHAEVFGYLRLLLSIAVDAMPQFLFVAAPSFWDQLPERAQADVRDLITSRHELAPLTMLECRQFAELFLTTRGPAAMRTLDDPEFAAKLADTGGRFARLVPLLSATAAAAEAPAPADEASVPPIEVPQAVHPQVPWHRMPVFASFAGLLVVAGLIGAATYVHISTGAERTVIAAAGLHGAIVSAAARPAAAAEPSAAGSTIAAAGLQQVQALSVRVSSPPPDPANDAATQVTTQDMQGVVPAPPKAATPEAAAEISTPAGAAEASPPPTPAPPEQADVEAAPGQPAIVAPPAPPSDEAAGGVTAPPAAEPPAPAEATAAARAAEPAPQTAPASAESPAAPAIAETASEAAPASEPSKEVQVAEPPRASTEAPAAPPVAETATEAAPAGEPSKEVQVVEPPQVIPPANGPPASASVEPPKPTEEPASAPAQDTSAAVVVGPAQQATPPVAAAVDTPPASAVAEPSTTPEPVIAPAQSARVSADPAAPAPAVPETPPVMLTPATAPPAPAPPKPTAPAPRYAAPDPAALVARGDAMLELGDVSAARLLYERAATLGNAKAATAAGKTYDPAFLTSIRASGLVPDRATAAAWYQKGVALGDREAADRLAKLSASR
ncbi:MAG TPA: AAA family ATPase [Acetobacteraceae bacterium]|jgi:type II secretory pathway predicted ATPase ExeA|nr:AAA family ATPase [Acetobacteraceae bacterium]